MATKKVDWNSVTTWERLIAAMLATGYKVDIKSTAVFFDTTYDTLENRLRKCKKQAAELKTAVEKGSKGVKQESADVKQSGEHQDDGDVLHRVKSGRVEKSTGRRKQQKPTIKSEALDDDGFEI